ncbi:phage holin [Tetragenococcus halophilus]|uniref:phage holin n=1 Tax=Tetragenococcus halophilus TaxID=51669 RepID=UPI00209AA9F9|nr:phage holin [Tetragenococcus halophilus]MCO8286694.1 phage holin [Tetragenococcus halophilus]
MEALQEQLIAIVGTLLTVVVTYAVKQLKSFSDRKGITERLKQYEESTRIAVKAVEEIYKNEDGPKKFEEAKKRVVRELEQYSIEISEDDLNYFIHAAVEGLRKGVAE